MPKKSRWVGLTGLLLLLVACGEATPVAQQVPAANSTPAPALTTVVATTAPASTTAPDPTLTTKALTAALPSVTAPYATLATSPTPVATAQPAPTSLTVLPTAEVVVDPPTPTIPPQVYGRDELISQLKQRVKGKVEPLLLPTSLPADLQPHLGENGYEVFYANANYKRQAHLIMAVPNPATGGLNEVQKNLTFHGARAAYDIADGTVATSHRFLMWNEPGKQDMGYEVADKVGYFLTSDGLSEAEFWQVANSLTPIPLSKNEQVAALPQSSFSTKGYLVETKDGIGLEANGKTYVLAKDKIKKIVLEDGQPGTLSDLKKDMVFVLTNAHVLPEQSPSASVFKIEAEELHIYGHR